MADAETDVAAQFASAWNDAGTATDTERALATDFWPCCRILADAGLLQAQETSLSAVALGPFRLAISDDNRPVVDFVEVLLPAVIAGAATGQAVSGAVSGVLSAACTSFLRLYRQGTVFGRGETDRLRWDVLMTVRQDNLRDIRPSRQLVVAALAQRAAASPVHDAIDWLVGTSGPRGHGPRSPLLRQLDDGGLLTTV